MAQAQALEQTQLAVLAEAVMELELESAAMEAMEALEVLEVLEVLEALV